MSLEEPLDHLPPKILGPVLATSAAKTTLSPDSETQEVFFPSMRFLYHKPDHLK